MAASLQQAASMVESAAAKLFDADPTIRSVGVGERDGDVGFVAVRNALCAIPYYSPSAWRVAPEKIEDLRVEYVKEFADPRSLIEVPHTGPGSPQSVSTMPEVHRTRPLVCGLQIQNFDDDSREGLLSRGTYRIGTLGCFVSVNGDIAILSNNHVGAGENRGKNGADRILQEGGAQFNSHLLAATLTDFVRLVESPNSATIATGNVNWNDADACVAKLSPGESHVQGYLPIRNARPPTGSGDARPGDRVFKVGRTTGLTFGTVRQMAAIVPIEYSIGRCWFRNAVVIEGENGTTFSNPGDSGSAVVRESDGKVVGLVFAGGAVYTYACPISAVLSGLNCILV
ncbi:hypothetical protein OKW30_001427 [Paraburkholderia sp. Clong3]